MGIVGVFDVGVDVWHCLHNRMWGNWWGEWEVLWHRGRRLDWLLRRNCHFCWRRPSRYGTCLCPDEGFGWVRIGIPGHIRRRWSLLRLEIPRANTTQDIRQLRRALLLVICTFTCIYSFATPSLSRLVPLFFSAIDWEPMRLIIIFVDLQLVDTL